MLAKLIDRLLAEDEENGGQSEPTQKKTKKPVEFDWRKLIWPGIIFGLGLAVRLVFLLKFEDPQNAHPGWYEDVYHHWQIAFFSKEIGFKTAFLRLWDLKGMEYFWGLWHPLVLGVLMRFLGTDSIVVARGLSLVCGSLNLVLIYILVKRYFNHSAGVGAALLAIFNPVAIFSDVSGMQEPLGILMFLIAFVFWPRRPFLTGLFWMLAGMTRAEYWLMGLGLLLVVWLTRESLSKKVILWLGYLVLMLFYLKYLLDRTGNPIYPMYWNFMGNMKGEWQASIPFTVEQLAIQKVYWLIIGLSLLVGLILAWKRPRHLLFSALGLGNWLILGLTVGASEYLKSYLSRFWVDRIMVLPYLFLAVWLAAVFLGLTKRWGRAFGWFFVLVIVLVGQYLWRPIWFWRTKTEGPWRVKTEIGRRVGNYYNGEVILFFEDQPAATYTLVYETGVPAEKIISQMYDPFSFYDGEPFEEWADFWPVMSDWMKERGVGLVAFSQTKGEYKRMIDIEPAAFELIERADDLGISIYQVRLN